MIRRILLIVLFILYGSVSSAWAAKYVRVAVIQNATTLSVKIKGPYEITDITGRKFYLRGRNLKSTVTVYGGGILIGGRSFHSKRLFIQSQDPDGVVVINSRKFRGRIQLIRKSNAALLAVNFIGLEDYIRGILYHEISHYWPQEAIKAQAIVSRTFTLFLMEQNKNKDFDATSDIYSQVYGGKTSERHRTNKAVDDTKGMVIMYDGKILPAFFHAACAGQTEDAALLWDIDLLPLKGVVCSFCRESPHYQWHCVLTTEEIRSKLKNAGYKIGRIKEITVLGRDKSKRITDINIVSDSGDVKIPAKVFRIAVGPNIVRSTNFSVTVAEHDVVFEGFGWGHGVGFCQWGAYFMAKEGRTAREILTYYYPGTDVKTVKF